jgi:hypothetical protein
LPLIPLRGCPDLNIPLYEKYKDEDLAGYLSYSEILRCLEHHQIRVSELCPSVQNVLCALRILVERYGDERVLLIFVIQD